MNETITLHDSSPNTQTSRPRVTMIPATKKPHQAHSGSPDAQKRRVAGYARVSTDHEEQLTSYEAQLDYYTTMIKAHDDWTFVGMYSDEGISGTSTKHRDGFNRMIADAKAGKIDLILTKSISRFARNTVDSISAIRELTSCGTEVFFEKENIRTFDSQGEILLTILSSFAQEESRSISENIKWGRRKSFAVGKACVAFSTFLGYDRGPNGEFVINEEQAKTVRLIYELFLSGLSYTAIAKKLTEMGIKSPAGKDKWYYVTVKSILTNEKYKGDALLQKRYSESFLTKKLLPNHGEVPQYYVENDHEAIIDTETFERVQDMIWKRTRKLTRAGYSRITDDISNAQDTVNISTDVAANSGIEPVTQRHTTVQSNTIFSSKLRCGCCGAYFGPKIWINTNKCRRIIWQCNAKYKRTDPNDPGKKLRCTTPNLMEPEIENAFERAVRFLVENKESILAEQREILEGLKDTTGLDAEEKELTEQMAGIKAEAERLIRENTYGAHVQGNFTEQYDALELSYNALRERYLAIQKERDERCVRVRELGRFLGVMETVENASDGFDKGLWSALVDYVTVHTKENYVFSLIGGVEVRV